MNVGKEGSAKCLRKYKEWQMGVHDIVFIDGFLGLKKRKARDNPLLLFDLEDKKFSLWNAYSDYCFDESVASSPFSALFVQL
jgi:hypothetical protein